MGDENIVTVESGIEEMEPLFRKMGELYKEWNARINVVSRKDIDMIYQHHILHSLCIALYLEQCRPDDLGRLREGGCSVLDVGCGGGFPGIPLAAMFPRTRFTLCDSIGKKVRVASEIASSLGLDNVECVHSRVEELPGNWDYVVSRAVTSLDNFLPWVRGRYRERILYLKGGDISEELDACTRRFGRSMPAVKTWNVSNVISDEYYAEKLVVDVGRFH